MQKPKVLYYLHTYFMDNAIEQLKILSPLCELHLVIELSPDSLKSTIIDFSTYDLKHGVHPLSSIIDNTITDKLFPYVKDLKSIYYAYYPSKRIIDISNVMTIKMVCALLKKHKTDIIHFDTVSARFLPAVPFLFGYKLLATIHDPIPHAGEYTFKKKLITLIYRIIVSKYLFYSTFAANQFLTLHPAFFNKIYAAKLLPYTYINTYTTNSIAANNYILYFGRLSYYKGIDLLLEALDMVWVTHPEVKIIIAGKAYGNYHVDLKSGSRSKGITYLPGYCEIQDLNRLLRNAMFVVCPYREATQSGVLMTALAMNKPVLATNVGAFPEYIRPEKNGMLTAPTVEGLANGIISLLTNNLYKKIADEMQVCHSNQNISYNLAVYNDLYNKV